MTDCQLTDEIAEVDNAGLENDEVARMEIDGLENNVLEIDGQENDRPNKTD